MRIAVASLFAAAGSLAAVGCVNDYLYGEGEQGTSTTTATDEAVGPSTSSTADASTGDSASGSGSTAADADSGGSSSSSSDSGNSDPSASTIGDGGGASSGSGGDAPFELCQGPCDANTMCGAESDLCVVLTDGDEPVCLRACGRGCPDGFTCQMRASVEGASGEQCVPDGNICP